MASGVESNILSVQTIFCSYEAAVASKIVSIFNAYTFKDGYYISFAFRALKLNQMQCFEN